MFKIRAKHKYLKSNDPKHESKHIIYLDAGNLYGYVMSKFLSTGEFKRMCPRSWSWISERIT